MLQLKNHSPFSPAINLFADENGIDALYVVVKATFTLDDKITLAEKQIAPQQEDEYRGKPNESSLKAISEMHLTKPVTDIVVIGHAYAPNNKAVSQMDCGIKVGNYVKQIRVYGDRYWHGTQISRPETFIKMPLIYENAFGGVYMDYLDDGKGGYVKQKILHIANPLGRGYRKRGADAINGDKLPNLEDPNQLIKLPGDQPEPACFGFIAPTWKPRVDFAGTYDAAWQKNRAPYLPKDFNNRFFNAAAKELTTKKYLKGGEPVMLVGLSPQGPKKFELPICEVRCEIKIAGATETPALNLETILFEPDDNRLCMTWRAKQPCDKKTLKISEIHLHGSWNGINQ